MPKTITLSNTRLTGVAIDPDNKRVVVSYVMENDDRTIAQGGDKIFWIETPALPKQGDGTDTPAPDNWIQLPPKAKEAFDHLLKYISDKVNDEIK